MILRRSRLLGFVVVLILALLAPAMTAHAIEPGTNPFQRTWARSDNPVAVGAAVRTWMWGPAAFTASMMEPYSESPDGFREVQYFDKSRMEITHPEAFDDGVWYVTNGLIARELVTGEVQMGDNSFIGRSPAQVNVAGDLDDPNGPTYASFSDLLDKNIVAPNDPIIAVVHRDGSVTSDAGYASYGVIANQYTSDTGHWIASPFWDFMNATGTIADGSGYHEAPLFQNPYYATGLPITDPAWARVKVNGDVKDVLMQVFERRVLTYTPSNEPTWQVEMGNVGQHYYQWRYGTPIPTEPPAVDFAEEFNGVGSTPLVDWPTAQSTGQAEVAISNQSPYAMTVTFTGPTTYTMAIPACPTCIVYPNDAAVDSCRSDAPHASVSLPPGNYRVQVTWSGANTIPSGGPWTFVPDATYGACWYIVNQPA